MLKIMTNDLRCVTHENQLRELVQEPLYSFLTISSLSPAQKKDLLTVFPGKAFCLLCTVENQSNTLPEAFVLPVQWKKGDRDSDRLPQSFRDQATKIRSITGRSGWILSLGEELREYDLSDIVFEADSIGVTLAAALEIAANGVQQESGIYATGDLKAEYIAAVGNVAAKARLVESLTPPGKKSVFFVPLHSLEMARNAIVNRRLVEVLAYSDSLSGWRTAMAEHLRKLHVPPIDKADIDERIEYINQDYIHNDTHLWRSFYLDNLLEDLKRALRKDKILHQTPPARMISAVSFSYELAILVMNVFQPKEIRFLVTPEISSSNHIKSSLMKYKPGNTIIHYVNVNHNEYDEAIVTDMIHWLMDVPEGARAVEATSGTKLITLSIAAVAEATGATMYYFPHILKNKSPVVSKTDRFIVVPGITKRR
jgi:hypothetical protein